MTSSTTFMGFLSGRDGLPMLERCCSWLRSQFISRSATSFSRRLLAIAMPQATAGAHCLDWRCSNQFSGHSDRPDIYRWIGDDEPLKGRRDLPRHLHFAAFESLKARPARYCAPQLRRSYSSRASSTPYRHPSTAQSTPSSSPPKPSSSLRE